MALTRKQILLIQNKAFHSLEETVQLCASFLTKQQGANTEIYLSAPLGYLKKLKEKFSDAIHLGLDQLLICDQQSFTGSIAGPVAKNTQAAFVIVGSAQERFLSEKHHASLSAKVQCALDVGLHPFLCIGDKEQEFVDGQSKEVLSAQLKQLIEGLDSHELQGLSIVYDAPWITQGLWQPKSQEYRKAIQTFEDSVKEVFQPAIAETLRLIPSVPAFSAQLPEILADPGLKKFAGYSFGLLDLSVDRMSSFT